jgi:nitroreductase
MDDPKAASDGSDSWPARNLDPANVPDLTGWFARRDTIRNFDPDADIPESEIREIVDAGRKAPTSGTLQMYSFVWVRDPETRRRIHEGCGLGQPQVEESSHFLLLCIDLRRVRLLHEHRNLSFEMSPMVALLKGSVDASIAGQGVMTVAESRGYGVCPIGAISERLSEVARCVNLPSEVLPIWGICIGIPAEGEPGRSTPRVPLEAVLHDGTYEEPSDDLLSECYTVMNRRYGPESDRDWVGTLDHYWSEAPDGAMNDREEELLKTMRQQGFFDYRGVDEERRP